MQMLNGSTITNAMKNAFPVDAEYDLHRGYRRLQVTGHLIHSVSIADLFEKIREVLPPDARLVEGFDRQIIRASGSQGYGADCWEITFSSSTWPPIPEGEIIPLLEPLFRDHPPVKDAVPERAYIECVRPGSSYEIVINKSRHTFSIPKDRETDDQVIIVVTAK